MNVGILIATVLFEIVIIFGVSAVLRIRSAHSPNDDFMTSGRNLPAIAVAATQALTCLGGGHIMGMTAASWSYGVATFWYAIASGIMLIILMCFTGPWVRRLGYTTINQLFEKMFNRKASIVMAGIAAGTVFGIMTLEIQGVGTVVAGLTGWPIAVGCVIGGIIAILYVIFGGMKEVGWVNVFNSISMYVCAFVALIYLGTQLPGGWSFVNDTYINSGEEWKLSLLANADTWKVYIIGTILAQLFYVPIGPQAAQVSASAKNVKSLRRAVFFAVPMNVVFGAIMIAFGMAAQSLLIAGDASIGAAVEIGGPPLAAFTMLINLLPGWLVAWLFASFAAAMLSTIAVQILALSTIFTKDIYTKYYNRNLSAAGQNKLVRGGVLVCAVIGTALSTALPSVDSAIVWLFAWLLPAFWMFTFGMFWKRSARATVVTLIVTGIANMIWTFTSLPTLLHLDGNNNSVGMVVVSFVVGIILTATDKNAKPGFIKVYKQDRTKVVSPDLLATERK